MTTKKPLILETDGVIGQLPNGGIINAGGTSHPTFTVGGRGLLFDDGTSTGGGGTPPPPLTLQGIYDASYIPDGRVALVSLEAGKSLTIGSKTSSDVYFTVDGSTGDVSLSKALAVAGNASIGGNLSVTGTVNGVNIAALKADLDKHLAGDPGYRHLAVNVDITPIAGLPVGTATVQAALEALNSSTSAINTELDAVETALGAAVSADGSYNAAGFISIPSILDNPTSFTDAIEQLAISIQERAVNRLENLLDVELAGLVGGNFLRYDGARWTNYALSIVNLPGVSITAPSAGNFLRFNGTSWVNTEASLDDLSDVAITGPQAGHVIYHNGTQFVNGAAGATSGVQPYSALLAAVAGLTPSADQLIYTTGTDTVATTNLSPFVRGILDSNDGVAFRIAIDAQRASPALSVLSIGGTGIVSFSGTQPNFRTLVAPTSGISITNADGSAGNPTFSLTGNLAGLEELSATGIVVRTAAGTFASRRINGTPGVIEVSHGDAVTSDITVNLAEITKPGLEADFVKVKTDSYGRVIDTLPVTTSDIASMLDATYVNSSGDTLTGSLTMSGGATITGLPAPVADTDAANKAYVDSVLQGLSWKEAVRASTTGPVDILTALVVGQTLDGVVLAAGDRVLVKDQASAAQNGIYTVSTSGTAVRAVDMSTPTEFDGAAVFVKEGVQNESTGWTQTSKVSVVDTSPVIWALFASNRVAESTTIPIGSPTAADISAGAVALTSTTSVGDGLALINQLLGQLVAKQPLCSGYEHIQAEASTTWTISHETNTRKVQISVYDQSGELIIPESVKIINTNVVQVSFAAALAGNAVLISF